MTREKGRPAPAERSAAAKAPSDRVPFWRSLQTKFALTYIVVIAAVVVLLNTYPVLASRNMVFQSKQAALLNQASTLASPLAGLGTDTLSEENVRSVWSRWALSASPA